MEEDKPKNLFEAVSRVEKERRIKGKKEELPRAQESEVDSLFQRYKKMHEEIDLRLNHLYVYNDITPRQLSSYVGSPKNFSERDWTLMQQQKTENEKLLEDLRKRAGILQEGREREIERVPEEEKVPEMKKEEPILKKEEPKKTEEPKKSKKAPITKRHWLQM
jgi:hypothetical protein